MEFRKMVMMTLCARQQKRHRCKEQSFGLCGRRWRWDDLKEKHWNMYITICKINDQFKFDAWSRALKAGALGQPRGMGWRRRWERFQDGGTHVHPWLIHVDLLQKAPQYCKVISLKLNKLRKRKKKKRERERLLKWVATSFKGSSQTRDQSCDSYISCIGRYVL